MFTSRQIGHRLQRHGEHHDGAEGRGLEWRPAVARPRPTARPAAAIIRCRDATDTCPASPRASRASIRLPAPMMPIASVSPPFRHVTHQVIWQAGARPESAAARTAARWFLRASGRHPLLSHRCHASAYYDQLIPDALYTLRALSDLFGLRPVGPRRHRASQRDHIVLHVHV